MLPSARGVWVDDYVLDTLMPDLVGHDRTSAALIVYLFLWRESRRSRRGTAAVSHQTIADGTGLSKSAVQAAVRHLRRRQLLRSSLASPTATPEHELLRPWRRRAAAESSRLRR